jgi:hypothetical protein
MMMIMVSNKKLNRAMLIMVVVLNSFLIQVYWDLCASSFCR